MMEQPILDLDPQKLYTNENVVYRKGVENANPDNPITVTRDPNGDFSVVEGNHRAVKALQENRPVKAILQSSLSKVVSQDPYFRKVGEMKVID